MHKCELRPGDVLSYSAGSSQDGPYGFRRVTKKDSFFPSLIQLFPRIGEVFTGQPPLIINCYPAALGAVTQGVLVDCYLSVKTACRALALAALENQTAILIGQPLFLAEVIVRQRKRTEGYPARMLVLTGGYPLPQSLQTFVECLLREHGVRQLPVVHCYGAAEVDAACLVGVERTGEGEVIYHTRDEAIQVDVQEGQLLISIRDPDGVWTADHFETGDTAHLVDGGYVLRNTPSRIDPAVLREIESWTFPDWERRTGYLGWRREGLRVQLREGFCPDREQELSYYRFLEEFPGGWLKKPDWSRGSP